MSHKPLPIHMERDQPGIACDCGGYCDKVTPTEEEAQKYGCGGGNSRIHCCDAAYVCRQCGQRYAGQQPAPESEDF